MKVGYRDIRCVESGGPDPASAAPAARHHLDQLPGRERCLRGHRLRVLRRFGDVVCGGFAMPIRENKAQEIYIVMSAR